MTAIAMAVDPGEMSGIAWVDLSTLNFQAEEQDYDGTCRRVIHSAHDWGSNLWLIAEAFHINESTHKKTFQPWSLELIGVCRFASRAYTGRELTIQGKSNTRTALGYNERLKFMGWYRPSKDGHMNDAAGHLLAFCIVHRLLPPDVLDQLVDI